GRHRLNGCLKVDDRGGGGAGVVLRGLAARGERQQRSKDYKKRLSPPAPAGCNGCNDGHTTSRPVSRLSPPAPAGCNGCNDGHTTSRLFSRPSLTPFVHGSDNRARRPPA